jgi:hypothetical protein
MHVGVRARFSHEARFPLSYNVNKSDGPLSGPDSREIRPVRGAYYTHHAPEKQLQAAETGRMHEP